ncbi:hypothetical protein QMK33_23305 [Hymenobacter sp. H14-R3]|uniref:DUF2231 domain-containing protein n=1 Tax=Hymenobacter sp. H14-R3 TaxID=3046308 RepID=UPI0024BBCE70|nr:DUF2231 domain-containing protein [Hymenobacter sp. H14-R3]MDJ0368079.1 hypothetical protein [Hymenobacter sp. H14-R3]
MNQAHWHLIFNHAPIFGALAGALLLAAGLLQKQDALLRAGLWALVLAVVVGLPAQLTGAGAAQVVKDMPRVSQALIQHHAATARTGYWVLVATGTLALLSTLQLQQRAARARQFVWATLLGAVLSFGMLARAGNLGGQISHPEIREGYGTPDEL